jgi:hypothetical protein
VNGWGVFIVLSSADFPSALAAGRFDPTPVLGNPLETCSGGLAESYHRTGEAARKNP